MKERPILFSGPMVRALLAGTKTQTRRVVKPQPPAECSRIDVGPYHPTIIRRGEEEPGPETFGAFTHDGEWGVRCPYGRPGGRLWVRENGWERPHRTARMMRDGADTWPRYEYDAEPLMCWEDGELKRLSWKRRPSIHMPRWASRITLEITGVRVERLRDISEADAEAEGLASIVVSDCGETRWVNYDEPDNKARAFGDARQSFQSLWKSTHDTTSWAANPWVWVLEFRRVQP
jgi:hypothetical protein